MVKKGQKNKQIEELPESDPSKFIIPPKSYWNMQWNNFTSLVFITWIVYAPLVICIDTGLSPKA